MGITITAIQLIGGVDHHHVAALRWVCDDTGTSGDSSARDVIEWLSEGPNTAWVGGGERVATLQVVGDGDAVHLQANHLGALSRELLELPRLPLYSDLRVAEGDRAGVFRLAEVGVGETVRRERRIDPDAASLP